MANAALIARAAATVLTDENTRKTMGWLVSCMFSDGSVMHCLLALGEGYNDGILIQSCGYDYPRYAAYIPGMRDILNAELERAAARIVQDAAEHTRDGSWRVSFDTLKEQTGLNVQVGNGLDEMLLEKLAKREDVFSACFGLTIQEIRDHEYLTDQELTDICRVPPQVLEGGMTVRDVLSLDGLPNRAALAHKNSVFLVPVEDLKKLTAKGQEDFAALLEAQVTDIRVDEGIPELLLEGVEAAELDRLHDELEAHEQAERAMGPAMG